MGAGDSFSFNADFSAPLQKIKISTVASRVENTEERKETKDRIDEERRHQTEVRSPVLAAFPDLRGCAHCVDVWLQACIVRIMKDRKHMTHNDLVNEVTRQLASRFQPNPMAIKKRIEGLIEVRTISVNVSYYTADRSACATARVSGALRGPQVLQLPGMSLASNPAAMGEPADTPPAGMTVSPQLYYQCISPALRSAPARSSPACMCKKRSKQIRLGSSVVSPLGYMYYSTAL